MIKRSSRGEAARVYMWTASRLEFEDNTVQLFCRASGVPEPIITWYDSLNNTLADDDDQFSVSILSQLHSFRNRELVATISPLFIFLGVGGWGHGGRWGGGGASTQICEGRVDPW